MTTTTSTQARSNLFKLIAAIQDSSEPVLITGKLGNAVLISEDNWNAIQETLYLLSIPGMRKSIQKGLKTPIDQLEKNLDW